MLWLGWLACTDNVTTGSGSDPDLAATQVGNDGGTVTETEPCEELALDPDSILSTGDRVGDLLARLVPPTRVAPTWFDGRTVEIDVDIAWVGGPIVLHSDCSVDAEVEGHLVADDGSVDQTFVAPLELLGEVVLDRVVNDGAWTGALAPDALHAEPCLGGSGWRTIVRFEDTGWNGTISHRCVLRSSGDTGAPDTGVAPDTGGTTDTTGPGGTTTLTGTTSAPSDETVTVADWTAP